MLKRINRYCSFYPCHNNLEDCTFCWCPYYPCADLSYGKYVQSKSGKKIWSCKDCSWIHKKEVVDKIFALVRSSNPERPNGTFNADQKNIGVIILSHGSRLKNANNIIKKIIKDIKKIIRIDTVEPAYLQLNKPDLKESVEKIVKKGCNKIILVPFFLFKGNHVARDIPRAVNETKKAFKNVEIICTKNIGQDCNITNIIIDYLIKELSKKGQKQQKHSQSLFRNYQ